MGQLVTPGPDVWSWSCTLKLHFVTISWAVQAPEGTKNLKIWFAKNFSNKDSSPVSLLTFDCVEGPDILVVVVDGDDGDDVLLHDVLSPAHHLGGAKLFHLRKYDNEQHLG